MIREQRKKEERKKERKKERRKKERERRERRKIEETHYLNYQRIDLSPLIIAICISLLTSSSSVHLHILLFS